MVLSGMIPGQTQRQYLELFQIQLHLRVMPLLDNGKCYFGTLGLGSAHYHGVVREAA
jgi:hypothetical protein